MVRWHCWADRAARLDPSESSYSRYDAIRPVAVKAWASRRTDSTPQGANPVAIGVRLWRHSGLQHQPGLMQAHLVLQREFELPQILSLRSTVIRTRTDHLAPKESTKHLVRALTCFM